jgi:hypothetical protein
MSSEALRLRTALVTGFPDYVVANLERRQITVDKATVGAIQHGASWLDTELESLFSLPASDQRQSPLELYRSALAFPTEALGRSGVPPVPRDPTAVDLFPDDLYDLAPGGSLRLGDEVRAAHIAWGATKAKAMVGAFGEHADAPGAPAVALVAGGSPERAQIETAVAAAGFDVEVIRNPGALADALARRGPALVFVDLAFGIADDAIRHFAARSVRVIAYGKDVDDLGMVRASSLGAHRVVDQSRLVATIDEYLPRIV